jgi:hypothetical protein
LKGEEQSVQKTIASDKAWRSVHLAILGECDSLENIPPLERIKIGRRLLDKSRESLRRVFYLSYAWRMTHNEKYLKRAEKELLAVSAFSDWNPTHFLDVAEMTMAVSIGYDWLYADLLPASRAIIKEAILKKGLEPSMDPRYNGWLKARHNWNQVCNAGIAYGAMAIYEDEPELARTIINRAIETIVLPMKEYGPDGAYPEGYGYWGYGTSFNVMFLSALEKALTTDFGLAAKKGFLQTAGFMMNMSGPSHNAFNFFDSGVEEDLQPAMFWFADKLKEPSLLWVERNHVKDTDAKKYLRNRLLPAMLIWSKDIAISKIPPPVSNMWVGAGRNPVAMMRSSWADTAIYIGFKGGSPSLNHGHMDVGSFVMDADGVRWAMDFGMQNYESLESKGVDLWNMKQNSQRWQVFRYNNFAHNTLTVNNELQKVEGIAPITAFSKSPLFMNAVVDMKEVYKGLLSKADRGIAIVDKAYVVVRDEIEAGSADATIRWTMATSASATIMDDHTIAFTKNGKKLLLIVQEPASVVMKTWPTDPVHDYDASNAGTVLVGFETRVPAGGKTAVTVLLVPGRSIHKARKKIKSLSGWPSNKINK